MLLHLTRDIFTTEATLGVLQVDYEQGRGAQSFGFTCEDQDRGLRQSMDPAAIYAEKVSAETAIPTGRYSVRWTHSPKYERRMRKWAAEQTGEWNEAALERLAAGKMPLIDSVPGFQGIRIHVGNDDDDTAGCILPGMSRNPATMTVSRSKVAIRWLYNQIADCERRDENVAIIIRDGRRL